MALATAATVGLAAAVVALEIEVAGACVVAAVTAAAAVVTLAAAVVSDDVTAPDAPQPASTSVEPTAMLVPAIARRQVRRVNLAIVSSQLSDHRAPRCAY